MLPFSRFEAKTILKLSGPIVLAQLTQTMMYVVDTLMAGRVSPVDMAGIAVASALWLPIILTFQGLLLALTPMIAQHYGASHKKEVTAVTLQGAYLAFALALLVFFLMQFIAVPVGMMEMDDTLRQKALDYMAYIAWGVFPAAGYMVLRNLFEGIGYTKATMWISFVGILVNIPANYIFIYGKFGMPALGGAGCGVATSLVFLAQLLAISLYALKSARTAPYRLKLPDYQPKIREIWQIIALGTPIAFAMFFEVTLFACIPLMIVHLGPTVVAAHQIANNYSALVFMLPLSMGMATTIRVGHLAGAMDVRELRTAISTAIVLAVIMAFAIAGFTFLTRSWVASLYTTDATVIAMASSILILACFYQISDAIQVVSSCALRGLKYTKPIFFITLIAYWPIGFGLGTVLGLTDWLTPKMGAHGFWVGIIVGLTVAAVLLAIILKQQLHRIEHGQQQNNTTKSAAPDSAA
ncbi:MATE family efflux transporter [Rheinheimera sp. 4Y26]|uniref:MATE family efflux transporter n=1 Tax=Rheinheimera sp. 4Y26 TaxID=2977811 RepID=UPI0021B13DD2|nr:MATE family efflux transporter [Rheinheimera sp. 4Y26]MCT6699537.1 MATE family efflux transporter [Rheinheimera sp. 4Y26]